MWWRKCLQQAPIHASMIQRVHAQFDETSRRGKKMKRMYPYGYSGEGGCPRCVTPDLRNEREGVGETKLKGSIKGGWGKQKRQPESKERCTTGSTIRLQFREENEANVS